MARSAWRKCAAAGVGLCVATLIARYVKPANPLPGFHAPEIAWAQTQGQLAWYRAMEEAGQMVQIRDLPELRRHVELWQNPPPNAPIGYILSLEGADSILSPRHLGTAPMNKACARSGRPTTAPAPMPRERTPPAASASAGRELLAEMRAAGHHPRCHPPVRRKFLGSPGPLRRSGLGQPQQLPGPGRRHAAVHR